ncbi:MAG TPA: CaiB/BaiF CoA-transferase family protein [Thermodesulfobacteriota bacterium]|nr:CaiB/BaiF CoA-transferase family protein [Thermodesulfobacteriota bacterium]
MRPLEGITILDLTRLLPGPYGTMLLGDLGAEVIKIEEPEQGDYARWYPPHINQVGSRHLLLNRNKKSITLNLKKPEGRSILLKMVEKGADVLIEQFRPGVMDRLGVGYKDLEKVNSRLVYCALTGFGQDGPYRDLAGHDINYIGIGGILGITGPKGGPPALPGTQIADLVAGGLYAVIGILTALMGRLKTGRGQFVDVSMLDGVVSLIPDSAALFFAEGESPRMGERRLTGGLPQYQTYRTKEGKYLAVGALEDKFWANLARALGKPDWAQRVPKEKEPRTQEIKEEMIRIFLTKTRQEWLDILMKEDTCVTAVHSLEETFSDPHVLHRNMLVEVPHPKAGRIRQIGVPIKFSETPGEVLTPAPEIGEHTEEILKGLGYNQQSIERLRKEGVIR